MQLLNLIKQEVEAGRVSEQTHPSFPELSIFKYTEQCSFNKEWNDVNRICRGLILNNITGDIIARSFPKFFNLGEMPESSLDSLPAGSFEVFEKADGSMGSIYRRPDGLWAVATPGSMDSDQARDATSMLADYDTTHIPENVTLVTEIIYPENRIVINYGNERKLILLAIFNKDGTEWERNEVIALAIKIGMPVIQQYPNLDFANPTFFDNQEGYVIRFASGLRVKIKSPIYVAAHRFLTNISISRIIEGTRNGTIASVAAQCPKDLADRLDDLIGLVNTKYLIVKAKLEGYYIATLGHNEWPLDKEYNIKEHRKIYALWIRQNIPEDYESGVFLCLSKKSLDEWIWSKTEFELTEEQKTYASVLEK